MRLEGEDVRLGKRESNGGVVSGMEVSSGKNLADVL